MRKMVCPQCKVGAFYVLNGQGERLPVYVSDKGEVVPKDPAASLKGMTWKRFTAYAVPGTGLRNVW